MNLLTIHNFEVALEAVSPIFITHDLWQCDIEKFWRAFDADFHIPMLSPVTGFHVHVSPCATWDTPNKFQLSECKAIAFGTV